MIDTIIMIIIGGVTGMVTGLTGASGVMVIIPLITLLFGMPIHVAIGTSLLADVLASIPVSYTYYRHNHTDLRAGIWIALGSIAGAQFGAFKSVDISEGILIIGLTVFMIFFGIKIWNQGIARKESTVTLKLPLILQVGIGRAIVTLLLGFILGLFTGFFGAGGGILIFLVLYFVLRLPLKTSIGTSALIMIITAASGAVGYVANGNIEITTGLIIGGAAAVAGAVSAKLANHIREDILAKIVGALFMLLGVFMVGMRVW